MEHKISDIFQFASCKYRWYLCRVLELDFDNIYTISGKIAHSRYRKGELRKNTNGEYEQFDLDVGDGKYLYGTCDAVLFIPRKQNDERLDISNIEKFDIFPMEYKPSQLKESLQHSTHMQCVAQARCLEHMFNVEIPYYYVYYQKEHRRRKYIISTCDKKILNEMIEEMEKFLITGIIPPRIDDASHCSGCLALEYCLPDIKEKNTSISTYIKKEGN